VRVGRQEAVHHRSRGGEDGVARLVAADSPAIEDDKDDGAGRVDGSVGHGIASDERRIGRDPIVEGREDSDNRRVAPACDNRDIKAGMAAWEADER